MKVLSLTACFLPWTLASLASIDIPPLSLPDEPALSGAALSPQYNGPREVYLFNPKIIASKGSRKRYSKRQSQTSVPPPSTGLAGAVYTMVNYWAGGGLPNFVLAYNTFANGSINTTSGAAYEAQGGPQGARFPFSGSVYQDALDSQGSLIQAGSRLFAVNAGSQSMSTWAINCTNPSDLIFLGNVQTNGQYPTTIAVAIENQIACVGSTGQNSGIECYTFDAGFGTVNPPQYFTGTNMSLPLPVQQNAGLPQGPPDTLSELIFTDDEKYLIAIVKGAANANLQVTSPGYINVYPITSNGLGQPVQSSPSSTKFLFGCVFKYNTYTLFCSDAGVGTVTLSMSSSLVFSVTNTVSANQINPTSMNCWTARSPFKNGPYYASAVNENYIAAFSKSDSSLQNVFNFTNGNPQLIEMAAANNFVYGLTYGLSTSNTDASENNVVKQPAITVARDLNLAGGFQAVQNIQLPKTGSSYEGMAVFVPSDESNICDFE